MRKWIAAFCALILLVGGVAVGYVVYKREEAADVRGSSTEEFVTTEEEEPLPPPPAEDTLGVVWPLFGYGPERHRVGPSELKPPFRRVWTFRARQLLEFPPVIGYGRLYFTNNSGVMFAVNAKTGKRAWKKPVGRCVAATPAVGEHTVFQAFMNRPPCNSKATAGTARRRGDRVRDRLREDPLADQDRADRVVAAPRRRARLRRRLARPRLRARRGHGARALDVPGEGPDQGRDREVGQPALRRHVRRLPLCDSCEHGEGDLADPLQDRLGGRGQFYSTPDGRLRARLHRLDRRQGLLVRRREPESCAGRRVRAAMSTGRLRSGGRPSTSARTATVSTRSTRPRATSSGGSRPRATSPARRRCSTASSTSRRSTSSPTHSTPAPASCCGRSRTASTRASSRTPSASTSSGTPASTAWLNADLALRDHEAGM